MKFKIDEITSVIQQEISQYQNQLDVTQVGKVIEVGDGIARIYGLRGAMAGEMLEFPGKIFGQVFNLEEETVGAVIFGELQGTQGRRRCPLDRRTSERARRPADARARGESAGRSHRRRAGRPGHGTAEGGHHRAGHRGPAAGEGALADGPQGHRRDDSHRPGAARTDHRGPQDRQDGDRDRHDPQPEAVLGDARRRSSACTSRWARRNRPSRASTTC